MSQVSEDDVKEALSEVMDPEVGVDIVSLGLIEDIEVDGSSVDVTMILTVPGCPLADQMVNDATDKVGDIEGVENASVEVDMDTRWSPDMASEEVQEMLGYVGE